MSDQGPGVPPAVPPPPTTSAPPPQPGAGQPLVAGPPLSTKPKASAAALNIGFVVAGLVSLFVIVVIVALLIHALTHH